MEDVTYGTVVILVHEDGTKEIAKSSVTTEAGVIVTLSDGDTVKIVDNAKDFVDVPDTYWGSSFRRLRHQPRSLLRHQRHYFQPQRHCDPRPDRHLPVAGQCLSCGKLCHGLYGCGR